jgi:hypothetical protein
LGSTALSAASTDSAPAAKALLESLASSASSRGSDSSADSLLGSLASSNPASESTSTSSSGSASGLAGSSAAARSQANGSGLSLPSLGWAPDPDSEPGSLKDLALPAISPRDRPTGAIDVPFEIVVVCRRDDLLLHPGGYQLTAEALRQGGGRGTNSESLLKRELRAMVRRRAQIDPMIRPKPSIKFLVETDGGTTFWIARRQLLFSGLDWPMSLQVAGPQRTYSLDGVTR